MTKKTPEENTPPASAYEITAEKTRLRLHTLTVMVDNEPGVLARVVGLFSGRGYNIESLTVSSVSQHHHLSRITLVTSATDKTIRQIKLQLARLIPVHEVHDLTTAGNFLSAEMVLIKLLNNSDAKPTAMTKIITDAEKKGASVVKKAKEGIIMQYHGTPHDVEQFIAWVHDRAAMGPRTADSTPRVEVVRSGVIALSATMKAQSLIKSDE